MSTDIKAGGIRAAIVDLDGTMIDTVADFEVALNAALADLSLPPVGLAFIKQTVGKGSEHLIRSVLAEVGADADLYDAAWTGYQAHYRRINGHHSVVYPGVIKGLDMLRSRGWALACLTNKPTSFARDLLAAKGMASYFSVVFGGDAFERKKPDPLPVLKTCEALKLPPEQIVMIGDSSNDARAARGAGCPVWLVSYGYNHGEPVSEVDCDGIIERIDLLPKL